MKKFLLLIALLVFSIQLKATDLTVGNTSPNANTPLWVGAPTNITVEIVNLLGYTASQYTVYFGIYSMDLKRSIISGSFTGTNLQGYQKATFTHSAQFIPPVAGQYSIYFFVSFQGDINSSNNEKSFYGIAYGKPGQVSNPHPNEETVTLTQNAPVTLTFNNCTNPIINTFVGVADTPEEAAAGTADVYTLTNTAIQSYTVHGLQGNKTYYWWVNEENGAGLTHNGYWRFFTVNATPPVKPTLQSPQNGTTNALVHPNQNFIWNGYEPAENVAWYNLFVGPTPESVNPSLPAGVFTIAANINNYTIPDNWCQPNSTLNWGIQVALKNGQKVLSDIWSLHFGNKALPDVPTITYPVEGGVIPFGSNNTPITFPAIVNNISNTLLPENAYWEVFLSPTQEGVSLSANAVATATLLLGQDHIDYHNQLYSGTTYYTRLGLVYEQNKFAGDVRRFQTDVAGALFGTCNRKPSPSSSETLPAQDVVVTYSVNINHNNKPYGNFTKTAQTNTNGTYYIMDLQPGLYTLTANLSGYKSEPASYQRNLNPGQTTQGIDFTFVPLSSSISGLKWKDDNGNGNRDAGETAIQDWTIYLNGTTLSGQAIQQISTKTDALGIYKFDNIQPGTYQITEESKNYWIQSYPVGGSHSVTIESGRDVGEKNFGNIPPKTIEGFKWRDDNGDGKKDSNEPIISGWGINLKGTTSGGQTISLTVQTDASGMYKFENILSGTYQVTEEIKSNWKQSYPASGSHIVIIGTIPDNTQRNFGNMPPGIIEGIKFYDDNGDGKKDANEIGINGIGIEIYKDNKLVKTIITGTKDINDDAYIDAKTECGLFSFADLEIGQYIIKELIPAGLSKTYPKGESFTITIKPGEKIDTLRFGNKAALLEFGDAPDPFVSTGCFLAQCYPTKLPIGARHVASGIKLGKQRDSEPDGQQTNLCDGDDKNGIDDEDGINITKYNIGSSGEVKVEIVGDAKDLPVYLYAWIDFNKDGFFGFGTKNPEENIIKSKIEQTGISTFTFNIPAGSVRNVTARFRISSNEECVKLPYGLAVDGEVEDYNVDNHLVGIKEISRSEIPNQFVLYQNYPNPFNPTTTFTYDIPKESFVKLKIFDAIGNELITIVSGIKSPGKYSVQYDGSTLPSGTYFYQLQAGSFIETKKFMLVK